jgi:hypothetical protein
MKTVKSGKYYGAKVRINYGGEVRNIFIEFSENVKEDDFVSPQLLDDLFDRGWIKEETDLLKVIKICQYSTFINPHSDREIGEVFKLTGSNRQFVVVATESDKQGCKKCFFLNSQCQLLLSYTGLCNMIDRKDRNNVFFREL